MQLHNPAYIWVSLGKMFTTNCHIESKRKLLISKNRMCIVHLPLYKHNKRNVIQLLALYLWFNIIPFLTVLFISRKHDSFINMITCNNGTEWSPIRPVIIRVIYKIRLPRSGSLICLITSRITDLIP